MVAALTHAVWLWLAAMAVRVTPLLLLALLADRLLHRRSASSRHAIWRATLGGTIALGIGTAVLPSWQLALLPERPPAMLATDAVSGNAMSASARQSIPARIGAAPASRAQPVPVAALLAAAWITITGVLLLRLLLDRRALAHSVQSARAMHDGPIAELAARIAQDLCITRRVHVLLHPGAIIPHTFGVWHATLVLPRSAEHWPRDRQERVITHELGHVRRGDALECVLMRFVMAVLWFHPLAWLLARRLVATREAACDDIVLLRGARASEYATDLLDTVRHARAARLPAAVPAMAQRTDLHTRLSDILDATRPRTLDAHRPRQFMLGACVVCACPLAALQLVPRQVVTPAIVHAPAPVAPRTPVLARAEMPSTPRRSSAVATTRRPAPRRTTVSSPSRATLVAARVATLDSICTITNGRTRGELLVVLASHWIEDAQFLDAYFRVLDGIPDARVRAEVVTHALTVSRTAATRRHARTIVEGLPDRRLREEMFDRVSQTVATASGSP